MVEDAGFRALVNELDPQYVLPSRKTITDTLLSDMYQDDRDKLTTLLSQVDHLALTTDMWTSSSNVAFISLTAHFVEQDKDFLSQKCIA